MSLTECVHAQRSGTGHGEGEGRRGESQADSCSFERQSSHGPEMLTLLTDYALNLVIHMTGMVGMVTGTAFGHRFS